MIVAGNGESRLSVDLKSYSPLIGCNAIHRDYRVDHLVAVDRRCVIEALESSNCSNTTIYTRKDWAIYFDDPRVQTVPDLPYLGTTRPDDPFHWGSGPYAVLLAAQLDTTVELVGFDLHGNGALINNVYKGTPNYNDVNYRAVDPSYWIYQISKVFESFPDKYFIVYNKANWSMPTLWKRANVEFKTLDILCKV